MTTGPDYDKIQVGDTLSALQTPAVDRNRLALFAGASGDHNPIHIDLDFAGRARFPDVFAQGMLGMAWLARLVTNWVPQSQLRSLKVRFVGITDLRNAITCTGRIDEKLELGGERCVGIELHSANQYGEVKIVGDALVAVG